MSQPEIKGLNIKYLIQQFEESQNSQNEIQDKEIILLVGPTGSGKTTTVNYLLGYEMYLLDSEDQEKGYQVIESKGGFEIGHSKQSHTIDLQLAHVKDDILLCDSPGFFDNRGVEIEIINASSLKKFMQNCKSVRVVVLISYHELCAQRGNLFQQLFSLLTRILVNHEKDQFEKITFLFTKVPKELKIQNINGQLKKFLDEGEGNEENFQVQIENQFLKTIIKQINLNQNAIVNPLNGDHDILLESILRQNPFSEPSQQFCFSISESSNMKLHLYVEETNNQITAMLQQFQFERIMEILIDFKKLKNYTGDQYLVDSYEDLKNEISKKFQKKKNQVFDNFCDAAEKSNIFSTQNIQEILSILEQLKIIDEKKEEAFEEGFSIISEKEFKNDLENICSKMSKKIEENFPQNIENVKNNLQKLKDFTDQTSIGQQYYEQSKKQLKDTFIKEKEELLDLSEKLYQNTNSLDNKKIQTDVSQIAQKLQFFKQNYLFLKQFVQSENEENFYETIKETLKKNNEELTTNLKTLIDNLNQEIQKQSSIDDSKINLPGISIHILKMLNQNSQYSECIPGCDNNYNKTIEYFKEFFNDALNLIKENTEDIFLHNLQNILKILDQIKNLDLDIFGETVEEFKQIKDEIKEKINKRALEAKKIIDYYLEELENLDDEDENNKSIFRNEKKDFIKISKIYQFLSRMDWTQYFLPNLTQNNIKKIVKKLDKYLELCNEKIKNLIENEKFNQINFYLLKIKNLVTFQDILTKYQEKSQACIELVKKTVLEKNKSIIDLINIQKNENKFKIDLWQTINQNISFLNKVQQIDTILEVKQNSISTLNTITAYFQDYYDKNLQLIKSLVREQAFIKIQDYTSYKEFIQNAKIISKKYQDAEKLLKEHSFEKIEEIIKHIYDEVVYDYQKKKKSLESIQEIQESYDGIKRFVDNMYEIEFLKIDFNNLDSPKEIISEKLNELDLQIKNENFNMEQEIEQLSQLKSEKNKQLLDKRLNKLYSILCNKVQRISHIFCYDNHSINLEEIRESLKKIESILSLLQIHQENLYQQSQDCLNTFLKDFDNHYKINQSKNIKSKIKQLKFQEMGQIFNQLKKSHSYLASFKKIFNQEQFNSQIYTIEYVKEEIQKNIQTLIDKEDLQQLQKLLQALDEALKFVSDFEDIFNEELNNCMKKITLVFNKNIETIRKKLESQDITFKTELKILKNFTYGCEEQPNFGIFQTSISEIEEEINEKSNKKYKEIFNLLEQKEIKKAIKLLKQIKKFDEISFDKLMKNIIQKTNQTISDIKEYYPKIDVLNFENYLKIFLSHMNIIDEFGSEKDAKEYDDKLKDVLCQIYRQSNQVFDDCDRILQSNNESFQTQFLNILFNHNLFFKIIEDEMEETEDSKLCKQRLQQTLRQFIQELEKLKQSQKLIISQMQIDKNFNKNSKKFNTLLLLIKNNPNNFDQSDQLKEIQEIGQEIKNFDDMQEIISNKFRIDLSDLQTNLDNCNFQSAKEIIFRIRKYSNLLKELEINFIDINQILKQVEQKVNQTTKHAIDQVKSGIIYDKSLNILMNTIQKADEHLRDIEQLNYQPQIQKVLNELMNKLDQEIQNKLPGFKAQNVELISQFLIQIQQISEEVSKFSQVVDKKLYEAISSIKKNLGEEIIFELGNSLKQNASGAQIVNKIYLFSSYKIEQFNQLLGKHDVDYVLGKLELSEKNSIKQLLDDKLKKDLKEYYEIFLKKYEQTLENYKNKNENWKEIVESVLSSAKQISQPKKIAEQKQQVLNLLAQICAYWSLVESGTQMKDKKSIFKRPNHTQIMSIILLLGIHLEFGFFQGFLNLFKSNTKISFQNSLIEVLTGQGKSLTLGFCSLILSLLGCEVDVVCYSTHLSQRDDRDFRKYFIVFGVSDKIKYGTFKEQAERLLQSYLDTRLATLNLIEQKNQKEQSKSQQNADNKIVLIDEVDVFFDSDFYGQTYNPSVTFSNQEIKDIITDIWNKRVLNQSQIIQSICQSKNYKDLLQKYPKFQKMFERHIQQLAKEVNKVQEHKQSMNYIVKNNQIGYRQYDSTISFNINYGYLTLFAYFYENYLGNINNQSLQDQIGFSLNCGHISYALLPEQYSAIMGVTGTLQSLNQQLKKNLKKYNIAREYYIPSMFGESKLDFKQVDYVSVEQDQQNQYIKIQEISAQAIKNEQSVLIFFKDVQELTNYHQSNYTYIQKDNYIVVTHHDDYEDFNFQIQKVTRSGQIGLFTREYGRGTDFICFDPKVQKVGGVVVIQTFLSDTKTEEIQIKGRTARQGQPGQYYLILNQKDIQKDFQISLEECKSWENNQLQKNLYSNLDEKRNTLEDKKYQELENKIKDAENEHKKTFKYIENIQKNNINQAIQYVNESS